MQTRSKYFCALWIGLLAVGCTEGDTMQGDTDAMGETAATGTGGSTGADSPTAPSGSTYEPPSTISETGTTGSSGPAGTTGGTTDPGASTGGDDGFAFDDAPPEDYDQIDRMGMPAVNTGVISSKDDYNESTPTDDVDAVFVPEIVASLEFLHGALDDDITGAGLTPCAVDTCVDQAAPLVIPDVLTLDLTGDAGFPNGRLPADPVMDITLAVLLLDLSAPGQDAATLAGLPLNPTENDEAFEDEFPFFAAPHR